ncbi:hypothetical protein CO700_07790 [Citrobacter koseri]|uniref:Uncharacterized protein n=1 Tax=Citrobacter koseri (strain ATCC BAA-895 / CDC 4225-83 / SGSC4696) TaxID=290338 RepID=A8AIE7_CITK8|nr:hypothetical protein CKO_02136 [Citrobacter koseri ATCC BAA-895]ATF96953.1 hypothetical protein CO700_07790 [Citrobacter koseri]KWZ94476.1 hypothetical protein HMPREF3220_04706 [Citrobacter koseri]KWZ98726.1 hypothetical protein HMPREF3207_04062 [Citrobacter koseri]KXB39750.1 hypothetical protein HMPREF0208_04577 [Citrobacter koseri]
MVAEIGLKFEVVHKAPKIKHLVTHFFFLKLILYLCSTFTVAKRWFEWKDACQTHKDTKLSSIVP